MNSAPRTGTVNLADNAPVPLGEECRAIYRTLFPGRRVPEGMEARYEKAHADLSIAAEGAEQTLIARCIRRGKDLEAVEVYLRSRSQANLLTVKCRLVSYLAETAAGHYRVFCNDRRIPWLWVGVCGVWYCAVTLYKRCKGGIHVRQCAV